MTSVFVYYSGASHITGQRLGDYLGVDHGRSMDRRYDYVIRWGTRSSGYIPNERTLNTRDSLRNASNKLESLKILRDSGIPVPEWTTDRDEIRETFGYPALGRTEQHTRGEDINLIMQWRDAYLTSGNDYFLEYIPTDLEYRMHVIDGEVVKIHEKRLRGEADNHPYIRNSETGWVFVEPRGNPPEESIAVDTLGSFGMDFGAVDVIVEEGTGDPYVLEVNSAPSLDENNLQIYGDKFAEIIGIEPEGLGNVSFDEE